MAARHPMERERVAQLAWEGFSTREISRMLDIPKSTVAEWIRGVNPTGKPRRELTDVEVERLLTLLNESGYTFKQACKEVQVSERVATRYVATLTFWYRKTEQEIYNG